MMGSGGLHLGTVLLYIQPFEQDTRMQSAAGRRLTWRGGCRGALRVELGL